MAIRAGTVIVDVMVELPCRGPVREMAEVRGLLRGARQVFGLEEA